MSSPTPGETGRAGGNPMVTRLVALAVLAAMVACVAVWGFAALIGWIALILCFWGAFAMVSSPPPTGIMLLLVAFIGLMLASVGTLAVPGVNQWLAPVLCSGGTAASSEVEVSSPYPGRTDATARLSCDTPSGPEKVPILSQFAVVGGAFAGVLLVLIGVGAALRRARSGFRIPALWGFLLAVGSAAILRLVS